MKLIKICRRYFIGSRTGFNSLIERQLSKEIFLYLFTRSKYLLLNRIRTWYRTVSIRSIKFTMGETVQQKEYIFVRLNFALTQKYSIERIFTRVTATVKASRFSLFRFPRSFWIPLNSVFMYSGGGTRRSTFLWKRDPK